MIQRKGFQQDTWEKFRADCAGRSLYIWGAGQKGMEILRGVRAFDSRWEIQGFIDRDATKKAMEGYPVRDPAWLAKQDSERYVVLISTDRPGAIAGQLSEMGAKYYYSYFWMDAPMKNVRHYPDVDAHALADVKRMLSDATSKDLLDEIAARYRAGFLDYSDLIEDGSEYFREEFFQDSGHEAFVDGGAFDGDTIEEFFDWTKGAYDAVYSFEPDPRMAHIVREKLYRYHDVHLFAKGLYDREVALPMELDNKVYSSRINVNGGGDIPCRSLYEAG